MGKFILIYIFFILILLVIPVNKVFGCSVEELRTLRNKASLIEVEYEYLEGFEHSFDRNNGFGIGVKNIFPNIFVEVFERQASGEQRRGILYRDMEDEPFLPQTINYVEGGTHLIFKIKPIENTSCEGELLRTIEIRLPNFNIFYNNELCEGIENYSLCQKFVASVPSESVFVGRVTEYRENLLTKEKDIDNNYWELIINFIINYQKYILGVLFFILLIIYYIMKKTKEKGTFL